MALIFSFTHDEETVMETQLVEVNGEGSLFEVGEMA